MLDAARRREFRVLIVPDLDRLARSLAKGLVVQEQLKKYGCHTVFLRVPTDDTPEGDLLKNQLLAFAQYERDKTRLRTMLNKQTKARLGEVVGAGPAPYGYRYTTKRLTNGKTRVVGLKPDSTESAIVARIFSLLPHRSTVQIADLLNEEGIPAPRGERWLHGVIYNLATSTVYTGTWVYGKPRTCSSPGARIEVSVPPIVDQTTWDEAQAALLRRHSVRRGRGALEADPYLCRGLLTCGHCGAHLRTRTNHGVRYYTCPWHHPAVAQRHGKSVCTLPAVHAVDLEAELWRVLTETLLDPEYLATGLDHARAERVEADQLRHNRIATIEGQITQQRRRLNDIATNLVDVLAGGGEFAAAIQRQVLEAEALITRLTHERDSLSRLATDGLTEAQADEVAAFAADVRTGLDHAKPADRRSLYDLLRLRGAIVVDAGGVQFGTKHRYHVAWQAAIPLRISSAVFRKTAKE